jgi:hypothetical protein
MEPDRVTDDRNVSPRYKQFLRGRSSLYAVKRRSSGKAMKRSQDDGMLPKYRTGANRIKCPAGGFHDDLTFFRSGCSVKSIPSVSSSGRLPGGD